MSNDEELVSSLRTRIKELETRLEISYDHPYDGIYARDETIKIQDKKIKRLEAERLRDITVHSMADRIERQRNHILRLEEKIIEAVYLLERALFFEEADEIYKIIKKKY